MRRALLLAFALLCVVAFCWRVPLVRVVPLSQASGPPADLDPRAAAEHLWSEQLPATFTSASDAAETLKLLRDDPQTAREQHGITRGVSRGFFLYLHGSGTVESIDAKGVVVELDGSPDSKVLLRTGMIFGSAVRDATGVVQANDAPSSEHFNALAQELNLMVEDQVIADLVKQAGVGKSIKFIGCVEIKGSSPVAFPVPTIPVSISIQ